VQQFAVGRLAQRQRLRLGLCGRELARNHRQHLQLLSTLLASVGIGGSPPVTWRRTAGRFLGLTVSHLQSASMSRSLRLLSVGLLVGFTTSSFAQGPDVCAPARSAKAAGSTRGNVTPAEVSRVLSVLAHDSLEGRGTGTAGGAKAARF